MSRCALVLTCLALVACGTVGNSQTPSAGIDPLGSVQRSVSTSSSDYVFVASWENDSSGAIFYFPVGSNGNVTPTGVISGADTQLTSSIEGVVVNASGEIFAALADTNSIVEFPEGANGDVSPIAVIHGHRTGLARPIGLAIDDAGHIFVANCSAGHTFGCPLAGSGTPSVEEFAPGSNGDVAPVRRIAGSHTTFFAPNSVALGRHGEIYVLDSGNPPSPQSVIDVFGRHAHGNIAPKRVIAGSQTLLNQAYGLAVTKHGIWTDTWNGPYLERFTLRATGNVAPVAVIRGSNTGLDRGLDGMARGLRDTVYVADRNLDEGNQSVQEYSGKANGNVAPLTQLTGAKTEFVRPVHVFVGPQP
jgi:hypothetical protein